MFTGPLDITICEVHMFPTGFSVIFLPDLWLSLHFLSMSPLSGVFVGRIFHSLSYLFAFLIGGFWQIGVINRLTQYSLSVYQWFPWAYCFFCLVSEILVYTKVPEDICARSFKLVLISVVVTCSMWLFKFWLI